MIRRWKAENADSRIAKEVGYGRLYC